MIRISIHSVPRSGSSWLGQILNSSEKVCFRFQPLFSYAFKDYLSEKSSKKDIVSFFEKIAQSDDDFLLQTDKVDRGSYVHNYHRPYGKLLGPGREKIQTVLEVGVFAGLGLHAWSRFFSNSQIEGVDKSFQYERKIKRLFRQPEADRIKLNWCDTTSIYHLTEHFNHYKYHHYFDIIFDDGIILQVDRKLQ